MPAKKIYLNWIAQFFIINSLLFFLIGLHYFATTPPFPLATANFSSKFITWLFIICTFLGQFGLFACVAALIPSLCAVIYPKKSFIIPISVIIAFICAWLLSVDTFVFAQYRFHLNGALWDLLTSGEATEVFDLSWLEWTLISLLSLVLLGIECLIAFFVWKKLTHKPFSKRYPLGIVSCLLASYYLLAFNLHAALPLQLNQQAYIFPLYYECLAKLLPGKHKTTALESMTRIDFTGIKHSNVKLHYPLHPLRFKPTQQKPLNIVFIIIDSWRFDLLTQANTPNIYYFAQNNLQFRQHFSGGDCTQPGIFSLFYALPDTYWSDSIYQQKRPLFIDELLKKGYQMGIFASASLLAPPFNQNVFLKIKNLQTNTPGKWPFNRDQQITKEFKQFIKQTHSPFFSFLFYDAAHSFCDGNAPVNRFKPSIGICNRLSYSNSTDPLPTYNRYKNALYYIDQLVGEDLNLLKQKQLLNNTLVIITGDHGNEFNDNHLGYWGHGSNFTHFQTQTPLVIHWPGKKAAIYNHLTMHYDIVPTLFSQIFGCQNPMSDYSIGQSLFDNTKRPFLLFHSYTDLGILQGQKMLTISPSGYSQVEDLHAKPLTNTHFPSKTLLQALALTQKFYTLPTHKT